MKKLVAFIMMMVMVFSMAGCGSSEKSSDTAAESQTAMTICMALNGSINDKGWNYSCYKGLKQVEKIWARKLFIRKMWRIRIWYPYLKNMLI